METRKWKTIKEYQDILFDFYNGIAKITINRPRYRNAFTPTTTSEISDALYYCRECQDINVVVLTGAGDKAFCSGGDMHVKGHGGYIGTDGVPRLNVLDVQKQIRSLPKPDNSKIISKGPNPKISPKPNIIFTRFIAAATIIGVFVSPYP